MKRRRRLSIRPPLLSGSGRAVLDISWIGFNQGTSFPGRPNLPPTPLTSELFLGPNAQLRPKIAPRGLRRAPRGPQERS